MTFRVVLTGGIGSGKSTVARLFGELGIAIIDADEVARRLVTPQSPAYHEIINHFGPNILNDDKQLNRQKLREEIFNSVEEKRWLEKLLHPPILATMFKEAQQVLSDYVILIIPLLVEIDLANSLEFDSVLVVDCPEALQRERLLARDQCSPALIDKMINTQVSRQERLKAATDVISNEGDLKDLKEQVQKLHQNYLVLSQQRAIDSPIENHGPYR